ncbi:hypothetical protein CRG98_017773, partial [Punica granatum]
MGGIRLQEVDQTVEEPRPLENEDCGAHQDNDQGTLASDMGSSPSSTSGGEMSPSFSSASPPDSDMLQNLLDRSVKTDTSLGSDGSRQSQTAVAESSGNHESERKPKRNRRLPAWQKDYDCRLAAFKPPPLAAPTDSKSSP